MKKSIVRILCAVMALFMLFTAAACGETETEGTSSVSGESLSDSSVSDAEPSVFPTALAGVEAIPVPDLANTGWSVAGGMIRGVEMEEADLDALLEKTGGQLIIVFGEGSEASLINGEQTIPGTYTLKEEGYAIHAVFEGYEYYGVFTIVDGTEVLVLSNVKNSEVAFYMVSLSEK